MQKCEKDPNAEQEPASDCFIGFCKDLLDEMAREGKFRYTFKIVGEQGRKDPVTGKWTGVIKEVRERVS